MKDFKHWDILLSKFYVSSKCWLRILFKHVIKKVKDIGYSNLGAFKLFTQLGVIATILNGTSECSIDSKINFTVSLISLFPIWFLSRKIIFLLFLFDLFKVVPSKFNHSLLSFESNYLFSSF